MLKKRIVPVMLLNGSRLVKSVSFAQFRDVGDPVKSAAVYDSQLADELVVLDVTRDGRGWQQRPDLLRAISEACFMPVSIGGGVSDVETASLLIANGADKVVLNSVAYRDRAVLTSVAEKYGSQAVIVGMDVRRDPEGRPGLYSDCGRRRETVSLEDHVARCETAGAGEIFVQSIDRDGTMAGMDIELLTQVSALTSLPVIACGGAGTYEHLREVFVGVDVAAIACGSLFNFSDSNPIRAKAFLSNYGLPFKVV